MTNRIILVLIAAIAFSGCTTMRPVNGEATDLAETARAGDRMVIYEKSGRIVDMTYSHLDGDRIVGSTGSNGHAPVEVAIADVQRLEKIDGAKTTLAIIGGTIVVVPLVALAGLVGGLASM